MKNDFFFKGEERNKTDPQGISYRMDYLNKLKMSERYTRLSKQGAGGGISVLNQQNLCATSADPRGCGNTESRYHVTRKDEVLKTQGHTIPILQVGKRESLIDDLSTAVLASVLYLYSHTTNIHSHRGWPDAKAPWLEK